MKLIATRDLTYATRRLKAGDTFEATPALARALIGVKKAKAADQQEPRRVKEPRSKPPPVVSREIPDDERERLREEAVNLGLEVDGRWGVDRLRDEIAAAQPSVEAPQE